MKKIILSSLAIMLSFSLFAQTPEILANTFLKDFQSKGLSFALQNAPSSQQLETRKAKIEQQFATQSTKYGKYYGYEELVDKKASSISCFTTKRYILKYENMPVQLNLIFYKPENKWYLYNLTLKRFNTKRTRR